MDVDKLAGVERVNLMAKKLKVPSLQQSLSTDNKKNLYSRIFLLRTGE